MPLLARKWLVRTECIHRHAPRLGVELTAVVLQVVVFHLPVECGSVDSQSNGGRSPGSMAR
jgi:hypothetical protein